MLESITDITRLAEDYLNIKHKTNTFNLGLKYWYKYKKCWRKKIYQPINYEGHMPRCYQQKYTKTKKYNELIYFSKYKMNMLENDKKINNICFDFTSQVPLINYCFNSDWKKTILILCTKAWKWAAIYCVKTRFLWLFLLDFGTVQTSFHFLCLFY
jgi:hypothetical protein